ncbi:hypothetical protein LTS08_001497 [Lithohypha guttulata]|uniref:uncharacterized protein n=1 Tax=Lithohypha guttulata TaxID=1690604 RepID=UPI002DDEEAA9|nr:hypothetical protein LTR51_003838 [Lithohypha guttulata]KAK5105222.1 hypothetical protein LTS08_001497 [Lithohypha guttulata]
MQQLEPQLAELFRTLVQPHSLLLRVAHFEVVHPRPDQVTSDDASKDATTSQNPRGYAHKILLTDGYLTVQALLHRQVSRLGGVPDVEIGDLVDIRRFQLKKSPRTNGRGQVVYLAIFDCQFIARSDTTTDRLRDSIFEESPANGRKRKSSTSDEPRDRMNLPPPSAQPIDIQTLRSSPPKRARFAANDTTSAREELIARDFPSSIDLGGASKEAVGILREQHVGGEVLRSRHNLHTEESTDHEDEDTDFFELIKSNRKIIKQRRQTLRTLDLTTSPSLPSLPSSSDDVSPETPTRPESKQLIAESIHTTKSYKEPPKEDLQLLPHPALREGELLAKDSIFYQVRDGTFALSQIPPALPPHHGDQGQSRPPHPDRHTQHGSKPQAVSATAQPTLLPSPPFHTLLNLRQPLPEQPIPSKNYMLTTLGVISWAGATTLQRAGSPFPPKRHVKITDPSLGSSCPASRTSNDRRNEPASSGTQLMTFKPQTAFQDLVTVAVYIDAAKFNPAPGTIALFRGLVMQRLGNGDIILNAYGRLRDQRFKDPNGSSATAAARGGIEQGEAAQSSTDSVFDHWYITDPDRIRALGFGSKLDYYTHWQAERRRTDQAL